MKLKSFFVHVVLNAAVMLTFVGCQKMPMACCDVSKTTAAVNETISFDASCCTNANDYEWDFGDGTKSTEVKTTHAYSSTGSYTVNLMVMSKNGKKMDEVKKIITIQ